jgi:hypothetical protein
MGVSRVTPTYKTEAGGGTWTTKSVPYGGKKATVEFYNKNGLVGSVYQDPDNPTQYKAFDESSGSEIASGSRAACKAAVEKIAMSRTGAKKVGENDGYSHAQRIAIAHDMKRRREI